MPYIFTSTAANGRQGASDLFVTFQNPNQISGPVGQSNIIPINSSLSLNATIYKSAFGAAIAAALLKKPIKYNSQVNALTVPGLNSGFLTPPDMVVSFAGQELREKVAGTMSTLGFAKHSSGYRQYFQGRASHQAVNTIIKNSGDMDTNAPFGVCNIYGFLAFEMMHKLVCSSMSLFKFSNHDKEKYTKCPGANRFIKFDTREAEKLFKAMNAFSAKEKEKAVKRKVQEMMDTADDEGRFKKMKKIKSGDDYSVIAGILGGHEDQEDVDMDDD